MWRSVCSIWLLQLVAGQEPGDEAYKTWMRYPAITNASVAALYRQHLTAVVCENASATSPLASACVELADGLSSMLAVRVPVIPDVDRAGCVLIQADSEVLSSSQRGTAYERFNITGTTGNSPAGDEPAGFAAPSVTIASASGKGAVYGAFRFLQLLQTQRIHRRALGRRRPYESSPPSELGGVLVAEGPTEPHIQPTPSPH
jgi:alpha-glucuronidase